MSEAVTATLLWWDLLSVFIILHLAGTDSSKNTTANFIQNETTTLGEEVTLQCNGSGNSITWTKKTLNFTTFTYRYWNNKTTLNNLTSERITVDPANLLVLKIHNVQLSDTGNYYCNPTGDQGTQIHEWRLTVTDPKPKGTAGHRLQDYLLYIIPPAIIGSALCIIVCLCSRKQQQNQSVGLQDTGLEYKHAQSYNHSDPRAQRLRRTAGHSLQDYLLYIIPLAVVGSALCIILCLYSRKQQQNQSGGLQDTGVEFGMVTGDSFLPEEEGASMTKTTVIFK
ncbi:hypothetical protein DPEC_G00050490 [Dallia pectoralis]|uniref:Uncharacterized protein n=1 Tax=Dallia pectoralis TaxID=75939 RepID=A0ACC2HAY7_DALPE|nr:hypothetical protein DPEC_G00050490 [Dallia pectoralis]